MKTSLLISFLIFLPLFSISKPETSHSSQSQWRTEYHPRKMYGDNFVGLELLGRGLAYSVNYDRALNKKISIGFGFTYYQMQILGISVDLGLLPVYANYYFTSGDTHRAFLGAGATVAYAKAEANNNFYRNLNDNSISASYARAEGSALYPNVALGYEFRMKPGFTTRLTSYAQYIETVLPWVGITLGTHF
jgi:hypothetical protein